MREPGEDEGRGREGMSSNEMVINGFKLDIRLSDKTSTEQKGKQREQVGGGVYRKGVTESWRLTERRLSSHSARESLMPKTQLVQIWAAPSNWSNEPRQAKRILIDAADSEDVTWKGREVPPVTAPATATAPPLLQPLLVARSITSRIIKAALD